MTGTFGKDPFMMNQHPLVFGASLLMNNLRDFK
jgi:hypothetical protein